MFNKILDELVYKIRHLYETRAEVRNFSKEVLSSHTSAELVFQQSDRFVSLIVFGKSVEEIESQGVELLMQIIQTIEVVRNERATGR